MGMGLSAHVVDIVPYTLVQSTCLEEYEAFYNAVDDIEGFVMYGHTDEGSMEYANLVSKFLEVTGMEISLGFHNSEERYDEVDGTFWAVINSTIPNPAISDEMHKYIDTVGYVTYS
jgi:hypothetical protein